MPDARIGARMIGGPIPVRNVGGTPRPQPEAPLARRTAIVSFAFFVAAALALVVVGVDLGTLQRTFPLYALGGFSLLIFGTSRLLIAGMAGRDIVGGTASAVATVVPAAIGAAGLFLAEDAPQGVRVGLAALWGVGALGHFVTILMTVRRPATRPPVLDPTATPRSRVPIRILEAASLLYALASAVLVPLALAGRFTVAGAVHVVLVGFVITTIMGTAAHILPRFTRVRVPVPLLYALVPFALVGPVLMAAGLDRWPGLRAAGAVVEGVAFVVFGYLVVYSLARAQRFRLPNVAYAAAPAAIAAGGLVALVFATTGEYGERLAAHGLLNVYGFVGLFVMAASTDLYGPALAPGAAPAKRHALVGMALTMAGLVVAGTGSWLDAQPVARSGMLAYAAGVLWQLVGIVASHRRAGRVVSRLQRAG